MMGRLKEKYTYEYFTGVDVNGNSVGYGAEQNKDENGNYILRVQDKLIVEQLMFEGKNVLELGVGRGECAKYILDHNPKQYVGVDFSDAAYNIAKNMTATSKNQPILILDDAYEALKNNIEIKSRKFDIVVMFDFVEHIQRDELIKILNKLRDNISSKAVIAINTPAYKYDNDVIRDGYDERNNIDTVDYSDSIDATMGMHCNKYSVVSLQLFMEECGFTNISETHFWVKKDDDKREYKSYEIEWEKRAENNFPIKGVYRNDTIEYSYINKSDVGPFIFDVGDLKGISIYTTEEYRKIAYDAGEYDRELFEDFQRRIKEKKIDTIIDVGCYVGINSMLFSKYSDSDAKIISFEPNPWNMNRIRKNLSLNYDLADKICLYKYALGNKDGYESMCLSSNIDTGYSSTSRLSEAHSKIHSENLPDGFIDYKVKVCKLDTFIENNDICPDVIKVDIEGAENYFLEGAIKTIKKYHPVIYMELHSEFCSVQCMKIFSMLGYSVEIIHEDEDNRILVCATFSSDKELPENENIILNNSVTISSLVKSQSELLLQHNDDLKQLGMMQHELEGDRKEIQILKEKIKELENDLEQLQNKKIIKLMKMLKVLK